MLPSSWAAERLASSTSFEDVKAALDAAQAGDVILIPPGTDHWTKDLVVDKPITLRGAGAARTILINDIPGTGSNALPLIHLTDGNSDGLRRVTEIGFKTSTITNDWIKPGMAIAVWGYRTQKRIDHCQFDDMNTALYIGNSNGLSDHNLYRNVSLVWRHVGGNSPVQGESGGVYAWRMFRPIAFDSLNYFFHENETVEMSSISGLSDEVDGNSYVIRHSSITLKSAQGPYEKAQCFPLIDVHGDNPASKQISALSTMIYENDIRIESGASMSFLQLRGGAALIFNNRVTSSGSGSADVELREERFEYGTCGSVEPLKPGVSCWPAWEDPQYEDVLRNVFIANNTYNDNPAGVWFADYSKSLTIGQDPIQQPSANVWTSLPKPLQLAKYPHPLTQDTLENASNCDLMIGPANDVAAVVATAASGRTICLESGNYGHVTLNGISRSSNITLQSTSDRVAEINLTLTRSDHLEFKNLTIGWLGISHQTNHITVSSCVFIGQLLINMGGNGGNYGNAQILIDGNTFDGINVDPNAYEGRVDIISNLPAGVTISNNHFGGAGESDGIQNSANGVIIGPGNIFENIVQGHYGRHVDAIQLYGQSHTTITGNIFRNNSVCIMGPDGGNTEIITNNVFVDCPAGIQLGSNINGTTHHNTFINAPIYLSKKQENSTPSSNAIFRNNISINSPVTTIDSAGEPSCDSCSIDHNVFNRQDFSLGTSNLIGEPQFVGGVSPTTYAGFKLMNTSVGFQAATDGQDMGVLISIIASRKDETAVFSKATIDRAQFSPLRNEIVTLSAANIESGTVFNAQGENICDLIPNGPSTMTWNGRNRRGAVVASGTYAVNVKASGRSSRQKVVVVK